MLPGMSSRLYPTLVADSLLDAHVSDQQDTLQMQLTTEVPPGGGREVRNGCYLL